jgi:DNA polymerase III subunit epsilon
MLDKPITIVDIETTGGSNKYNAITEIAIIKFDSTRVIDEYSTLINPGRSIPANIQRLTGITNAMLVDAPYFEEVAETIFNKLEGSYFMAHHAIFDFSFVKRQLTSLGYDFKPRLLCSVKLSRALYPLQKPHSLEHIIKRHKINVDDRHRAYADTKAVYDFVQIAIQDLGLEAVEASLMSQLKYKTTL